MLKLANAPASCAQLGRLSTAEAWSAAVVDVVLAQPVVEGDGVDAEVLGGLLDLAAPAHERDGTGTKLRRVWARHAVSLP